MKHHCKEKRTYIPLQIIIVEDNTEEVTAVDYEVAANSKSSEIYSKYKPETDDRSTWFIFRCWKFKLVTVNKVSFISHPCKQVESK